ncbi:alpha/beta fold hydrolase [Actinokineospora auranticolor]|uniref:alpha/beta fold hydrolase n=1 Tax=Actinokineospora auranticolor TaxID=155976 RepID=UPI001FEB795C|nr:alpha/beta fold hydrolase [Actinokineospora auranticolor]
MTTPVAFHAADGCPLHAAVLGSGPPVVLMHGGGPDHESLIPLARALADAYTVVLPDVRGYGRSVCVDPTRHTWNTYADDVVALLDHLDLATAVVGGTGLGSSITLRTCARHPSRVRAALLLSVENVEDDKTKAAEIAYLDAFAARVRLSGIEAAWASLRPHLAPVITTLVTEAIPRSTPASIAAAAAIGHDRLLTSIDELAAVDTPALIVPGIDHRHPPSVARAMAAALPRSTLADALTTTVRTAADLATAFAPPIKAFLAEVPTP